MENPDMYQIPASTVLDNPMAKFDPRLAETKKKICLSLTSQLRRSLLKKIFFF